MAGNASLSGLMLKVVVASTSGAGPTVDVYPRELQGLWFSDDRDGRTQCRAYQTAYKSNADNAFDLLTGSEMISHSVWHSVAEYGEGNFYKLRRLSATGAGSWRIEADVGIDSYPDGQESERAIFEVRLAKRKLLWLENSLNFGSGSKRRARRFFRCSAVPENLRR